MDPVKAYDYLVIARQRILDLTRPLTVDQYTRVFSIGYGSLARTLTHVMICEDMYSKRIQALAVPPYKQWPIQDENPPDFAIIEKAWMELAPRTRAAIAGIGDWTTPLEYEVTHEDGRKEHITATRADICTQLILHEVHHRAQAMNILRQLGARLEDIDYSHFMYKRRPA
ncbi:MAG: DinB family protein [Phycisphaerales bacterium]|nr:DinB family protein [Phycisphaerales bacterium]